MTDAAHIQPRKRRGMGDFKLPRRAWSIREEEGLIVALKDVVNQGWKCENGFRTGYLGVLEQEMKKLFPSSDIKADPHIQSKIHIDPFAKNMRLKSFPFYRLGARCSVKTGYGRVCRNIADATKPCSDADQCKHQTTISQQWARQADMRLEMMSKRMGFEFDASEARKKVYEAISGLGGLQMREKLFVAKKLVSDTKSLDLFFSLPDDEKAELIRMMLDGSF
ncbi:UNVERIFIED_CONTAM: hypothetical protein Slati_0826200 [Sesamum latifolium]|uniref:Uncharacterized protein n=1 Tax=Sesamum latifolium TaxID=2727402 RepID=A0AAW2XLJ8_9LAMI